jgi:hypothetical protein
MTIDRRRWRRLTHELRLQLHVLAPEPRVIVAVGTHLNPEGIFVETDDPPPMGARIRVTLAAEGTAGALTAEGEVVDRVEPGSQGERPAGVGVKLEQAGPAWQKLYAWLGEP